MKTPRLFWCASVALALVVGIALARQAPAAEDESDAVRRQCNAFVVAFNAHDAKGMAAVFAPDGDAVNPFGAHYAGRAEVEKLFLSEHGQAGPLRESTVKVKDEPVRFLTADVAVSDADVVVTGAYGPDGAKGAPMSLIVTNVWRKSDGTWWIAASRPHFKAPPPAVPAAR